MKLSLKSLPPTPIAVLLLCMLALTCAAAPSSANATELTVSKGFSIEGQVQHARHFTAMDLQRLPVTQVSVSYVTKQRQETGTFSGVLLWTLLNDVAIVDGAGKGALLRHFIIVSGRDGYSVVLSAGELAPEFEDKLVILATTKNGRPLRPEEGVRLIVPSDKHGGRAVRDVAKIDVK